MEVIVAEHAGFCFGVTKAVETVYDQINAGKTSNIYTYGPIIHNETVVADLEKKGVKVINDIEDLERLNENLTGRDETLEEKSKISDAATENKKSDNSFKMTDNLPDAGKDASAPSKAPSSADSKGITHPFHPAAAAAPD